jgi:hypothetical protein
MLTIVDPSAALSTMVSRMLIFSFIVSSLALPSQLDARQDVGTPIVPSGWLVSGWILHVSIAMVVCDLYFISVHTATWRLSAHYVQHLTPTPRLRHSLRA